jgi:hypothetical protein
MAVKIRRLLHLTWHASISSFTEAINNPRILIKSRWIAWRILHVLTLKTAEHCHSRLRYIKSYHTKQLTTFYHKQQVETFLVNFSNWYTRLFKEMSCK